ncbi:hypothetical protein [Sulfitobacter sp.]|uniref:hypothetical protein n=1 Tax=Sulfitobacter sp. TaxID=1903071 RepID=UPI003002388D
MLCILILGGLIAVGFLTYRRFQRGAYLAGDMSVAPAPVRAAAKRLGFHAQPNVHSIVSVPTAELCVAAMAVAFAQMDDKVTPDEDVIITSLKKHLQLEQQEAQDMALMGPWLVEQGGGPTPAFERLTKRLKQLDHGPVFSKMMNVIGDVKAAGTKGMASARQADAMGTLARIFRTA